MPKFNDDDVAPRAIRCTKAEGVYLRKVVVEMRKTGWDPLAERGITVEDPDDDLKTPDLNNANTPIRKIDFGISPEQFLKNHKMHSLVSESDDLDESDGKEYSWREDSDMLEFERGLNWEGGDINQCYPEIMAEVARIVGTARCQKAASCQKTNRTAYNEIMEEIYQVWKGC